ncbi:hypothetical protein GBAR_LOCUS19882 [Geodia barretti]|nr:hypothetical protein GBAR_LOCUS19882 [Geodia barretti]
MSPEVTESPLSPEPPSQRDSTVGGTCGGNPVLIIGDTQNGRDDGEPLYMAPGDPVFYTNSGRTGKLCPSFRNDDAGGLNVCHSDDVPHSSVFLLLLTDGNFSLSLPPPLSLDRLLVLLSASITVILHHTCYSFVSPSQRNNQFQQLVCAFRHHKTIQLS